MRTVVLVPRRADNGRRDELWRWVKQWMQVNHPDWPIYEGTDDGDVFSMSTARNDAARRAGDWDVAVILDADTFAHPDAVREAVIKAHTSRKIWAAGDMRMRCDRQSSDRILNGHHWFPRPEGDRHPKDGVIKEMCYGEPSSGVLAIGRPLWDATGGYVEALKGWGFEDLAFITQCYVVGDGMGWVRDSMILHLWHPRTPLSQDTVDNKRVWLRLHGLSKRDRLGAKAYLRQMGHQW